MNAIGIILFIIAIIILESLEDSLVYLSWTRGKYGAAAHVIQLFSFACIFLFGYLFPCKILSLNTFYIVLFYIFFRFGYFDIFYNWMSSNSKQGATALFDKLTARYPILNNTLIRVLVSFVGLCLLILKFKENGSKH